jgi:hypothetical protein
MEVYKRTVSYKDLNYRIINSNLPITASTYVVTATTLYFPIVLTQNFEDIGLYTDAENPMLEVDKISGVWDLTNTGQSQKVCGVLNNCTVNFIETPISYFGAKDGKLQVTVSNCPSPQKLEWTGPNGFGTSTPITTSTITGLGYGNYNLKITDNNCDITYVSYFMNQPQGLSLSLGTTNSQINDVNGTCNGSASINVVGGEKPYTYLWYSGNTSNVLPGTASTTTGVTNLCAGYYSVQITDSKGIIVSGIFNITEPSSVSGNVTTTINIICNGGETGSITLQGVGGTIETGYTFTIISGPSKVGTKLLGTSVTFNDLKAGNYNIKIEDSVGSYYNQTVTLSQSTAMSYNITTTNISCFGVEDGKISVTPQGGTPGYILTLKQTSPNTVNYGTPNGTTTFDYSDLPPGSYQFSILDSNDCQGPTQNITLYERPELVLTKGSPLVSPLNGYDIHCYGDTLTIPFTASYNNTTYTYSVTSNMIKYYVNDVYKTFNYVSSTTPNTVNLTLSAGTNTIKIVDENNCESDVLTLTLKQPPMPLSVIYGLIKIEDSACGTVTPVIVTPPTPNSLNCACTPCGSCRQAAIDINGGVAPYTIVWSDGGTSNQLTSAAHCLGYGNVTVTITDANNCTVTATITI